MYISCTDTTATKITGVFNLYYLESCLTFTFRKQIIIKKLYTRYGPPTHGPDYCRLYFTQSVNVKSTAYTTQMSVSPCTETILPERIYNISKLCASFTQLIWIGVPMWRFAFFVLSLLFVFLLFLLLLFFSGVIWTAAVTAFFRCWIFEQFFQLLNPVKWRIIEHTCKPYSVFPNILLLLELWSNDRPSHQLHHGQKKGIIWFPLCCL